MTDNPYAPKMTETQREEALRRNTGGYAQLRTIGAPTEAIYCREFGKFKKVLEIAGIPQRPPHVRNTDGEPQSKWRRFVQRFETLEHAREVSSVPFRRLAQRRRFPGKDTAR